MALQADLSAATLVSAETPIQTLPCMKGTQVGAGPCLDLQCVFLLQSTGPTEHFGGVDRYEAAERLRDFVPRATPAQRRVLLREAEVAETGAEGAQDFKRAEGTRVLVEAALLARAGERLLLGGKAIIPPMPPTKAREVTATSSSQAAVTNQASATNPAEDAPRPLPVHGDQMARGKSAATAGAALSTATSTVLTGGGVAPSSGQPASASQSLGAAAGAASFTAADGISAADRARAKVANDELVELVLGADATRPREMTASLDHVAYHMRNDDHKSTFVHLNNALERAGKVALRLGLDKISLILAQTRARGEKLVVSSRGDVVSALILFSDLLPNQGGVHHGIGAYDAAQMRARQRMAVPSFGAQGFQPGTHAVIPAAVLPVGNAIGSGLVGVHMMGNALPGLPVPSVAGQGFQRSQNTGRSAGGRAPKPRQKGAGGGGQGKAGSSAQKMQSTQIRQGMNGAAQQQQRMSGPGAAGGMEPCRLCVRDNRNPYHSYLQCAFVVCYRCKQTGHRKQVCPNKVTTS